MKTGQKLTAKEKRKIRKLQGLHKGIIKYGDPKKCYSEILSANKVIVYKCNCSFRILFLAEKSEKGRI